MFDKAAMSCLLYRAVGAEQGRSLNEYGRQSGVSASYISRLQRQLVSKPPGAGVLKKLAVASADESVTYDKLMEAAGWICTAAGGGEVGPGPEDMEKEKKELVEFMYRRKISPREADQILRILRLQQKDTI